MKFKEWLEMRESLRHYRMKTWWGGETPPGVENDNKSWLNWLYSKLDWVVNAFFALMEEDRVAPSQLLVNTERAFDPNNQKFGQFQQWVKGWSDKMGGNYQRDLRRMTFDSGQIGRVYIIGPVVVKFFRDYNEAMMVQIALQHPELPFPFLDIRYVDELKAFALISKKVHAKTNEFRQAAHVAYKFVQSNWRWKGMIDAKSPEELAELAVKGYEKDVSNLKPYVAILFKAVKQVQQTTGRGIKDIHGGNWAMDDQGNPTIIDAGFSSGASGKVDLIKRM